MRAAPTTPVEDAAVPLAPPVGGAPRGVAFARRHVAKKGHLSLRPRPRRHRLGARPSGERTTGTSNGEGSRTVRRRMMLLGLVGAVLASGGVVLAADIPCPSEGGRCAGTNDDDRITGSMTADTILAYDGDDFIDSFAGNDTIRGGEGSDQLEGGAGATGSDDDALFGGPGPDSLYGYGGDDLLAGGPGTDTIDATETSGDPGTDTVKGGGGSDGIDAADGHRDRIDCGTGSRDEVWFDKSLDTVENCEIKHPR